MTIDFKPNNFNLKTIQSMLVNSCILNNLYIRIVVYFFAFMQLLIRRYTVHIKYKFN